MKILVFADSRGKHKPAGSTHQLYVERLQERYDVTSIISPTRWTTIPDFLAMIRSGKINPQDYAYIVLHVGVSDFSPRHQKVALEKIYAEKKEIYDELFGEKIRYYLMSDLGVEYENDKTINMYSKDMLRNDLLPRLQKIPNLIWISCNNIVEGWNGDYFRERPSNIRYLEGYSQILVEKLVKVVDLHRWTAEEVRRYTCDNMHLTKSGSDYIYNELERLMNPAIEQKTDPNNILIVMGNGPSLKEIDFDQLRKYDTFGLNGAYRKYEELKFYPTYFGCFDFIVCNHHKENFSKLVLNSPIKQFFFLTPNYFDEKVQNNHRFTKLNFIHPYRDGDSSFNYFIDMGSSGANATQAGILMGYKKIILVGCDANYIDFVEGSERQGDHLIIKETPEKNPNYWFDEYQQTNDVYNIPLAQYHLHHWSNVNKIAKKRNVDIVNCSPISKINCFRKSTLKNELPPS